MNVKELFKLTWLPVLVASLCCLSPLILVLAGLSTASFAASLADTFYGSYRWIFRIAGLLFLGFSLWLYFWRKGICTIDEAKKRRTEIINTILLVSIVAVIGYVVFLYGIVEYAGERAGIFGAPRFEQPVQHIAQTQHSPSEEVSFPASDGYTLRGTLWTSADASAPAIILVHQYGSDRHDFDAFVPELFKEGYTVLAYDIRSFGESQDGAADINDFPKDVLGAIRFLTSRNDIHPAAFGIIGASVGANVAYVSSGSIPEISAAVSLSPSNTGARGVLLGHDVTRFNPHAILVASDDREKADADFIFNSAHDPKEEKTYPGFGHGVALLRSPQARADILSFLRGMLLRKH